MIKKLFYKLKNLYLKRYFAVFMSNFKEYSYHSAGKNFKTRIIQADDFKGLRDKQILEFVKKVYFRHIKNNDSQNKEDMWDMHLKNVNRKLIEYLDSDQDKSAIDYLNNMFINGATTGFMTYGGYLYSQTTANKNFNKNLAAFYMDSLVNLAEYLGVIPVENVEQRVWETSLNSDPDEILDKIESKLGIRISFPKFRNGMPSIKTRRGFFNNRDMYYIYISIRIKDICKNINQPSICEIGGGLGLLCYYLDMFGIKDFTSVDIISTSLFSSYFLMRNMEERQFADNFTADKTSIKILSPEDFLNISGKKFDVLINCDSFPEIDKKTIIKYLEKIRESCDNFFSINQEASNVMYKNGPKQNIVHKLISELSPHNREFHNISRNLFWIRRGYVEELYEIK